MAGIDPVSVSQTFARAPAPARGCITCASRSRLARSARVRGRVRVVLRVRVRVGVGVGEEVGVGPRLGVELRVGVRGRARHLRLGSADAVHLQSEVSK